MKMTKAQYETKVQELQKQLEKTSRELEKLKKYELVDPNQLPNFEIKQTSKGLPDDIYRYNGTASKLHLEIQNIFHDPRSKLLKDDSPIEVRGAFMFVRGGGKYERLGFFLGDVDASYDYEWVVVKDDVGAQVLTTKANVEAVEKHKYRFCKDGE